MLYTSAGLSIGLIHDADGAVIMARALNDWLHEYFLRVNHRVSKGGAVGDPGAARIRQRTRTLRARLGMVGGMLAAVMNPRAATDCRSSIQSSPRLSA